MYMSQMCPARIIGTSIFTPTKLLKINKIILKSNLNKLKPFFMCLTKIPARSKPAISPHITNRFFFTGLCSNIIVFAR